MCLQAHIYVYVYVFLHAWHMYLRTVSDKHAYALAPVFPASMHACAPKNEYA